MRLLAARRKVCAHCCSIVGTVSWFVNRCSVKVSRMAFRMNLGEDNYLIMGGRDWAAVLYDGLRARIRFRETETKRLVPDRIVLEGDTLTATEIRKLPLGKLVTIVNAPMVRGRLSEKQWELELDPSKVEWSDLAPQMDRMNLFFPRSVRIDLPSGRGKTERFYLAVADAFASAVAAGSEAPSEQIAEETDVPVSTVHGWLREARRRGIIPS